MGKEEKRKEEKEKKAEWSSWLDYLSGVLLVGLNCSSTLP